MGRRGWRLRPVGRPPRGRSSPGTAPGGRQKTSEDAHAIHVWKGPDVTHRRLEILDLCGPGVIAGSSRGVAEVDRVCREPRRSEVLRLGRDDRAVPSLPPASVEDWHGRQWAFGARQILIEEQFCAIRSGPVANGARDLRRPVPPWTVGHPALARPGLLTVQGTDVARSILVRGKGELSSRLARRRSSAVPTSALRTGTGTSGAGAFAIDARATRTQAREFANVRIRLNAAVVPQGERIRAFCPLAAVWHGGVASPPSR